MLFLVTPSARTQIPNDDIDDTVWLQKYIDDLSKPATTERKPLAAGRYLASGLKAGPAMGLKLEGAGGQNRSPNPGWDRYRVGTIIQWNGKEGDKPLLTVAGCSGLVLEGINFEGAADTGLLISHGHTGCLNIAIRNCGFIGMKKVGILCGIGPGEATSANVTYDNCHFDAIGEACVRIVNEQSLEHLFLRPQFAWTDIAIDVQGGGDVSVLGGGSYEIKRLLNLGRVGSNSRGFDISSVRLDGDNTRSAYLTFDDTDTARSYGTITFSNMTQNNGQRQSTRPLITVAPGARVVARECSFNGSFQNFARVHSDNRANGELIFEYCDGISSNDLGTLVQTKGTRSYYKFNLCGSIWGPTKSLSTFPGDIIEPIELPAPIEPVLQFTEEEVAKIKRMIAGELRASGELKVQLPE